MIVEFIREHADRSQPKAEGGLRWGVEPICRVLTEHGVKIAPSTYYAQLTKAPTNRQRRDAGLLEQAIDAANKVIDARRVPNGLCDCCTDDDCCSSGWR